MTTDTTSITRKSALPVDGIEPYVMKKNEEYMNDDQLKHFRDILLAWKKSLMEEVDRTVDHMQEEASSFSDPADRATQEEEFTLELRARDRERKLVRKIDKTIVRVDADDYRMWSGATQWDDEGKDNPGNNRNYEKVEYQVDQTGQSITPLPLSQLNRFAVCGVHGADDRRGNTLVFQHPQGFCRGATRRDDHVF